MPRQPLAFIICVMTQMTTVDRATRSRFYAGLADPTRLAILDALRAGERTVSAVAAETGLSISAASRQLACLRSCGLVVARQEWRHVRYQLADGVGELLDANDAFLNAITDRIAACQSPLLGGPS
ncbi:MAG: metalloregulator ArsR/SmtB family transcription factor [Dehalococcoidia bacterium]|nr:metalloregulator ArsR/SmtB family transcription factor [Dehalococcoidia bacterium]